MRLNRKLLRRRRALAAKSWSTAKRERIGACLVTALMSSDDDDSDNEGQFLTRKLPWRSADMTKILIKLDKKAGDLLSPRGKLQKVPVIRVEEVSTRPAPTILPVGAEWALA
ncbi:hypothetical protein V1264_022990 [Littorina saxatilis]|uniref:Uncharacterized protein n=2 Tax=Littorina saxatilis TaxID=31220 RepID=A0AAN9B636_9CAEN